MIRHQFSYWLTVSGTYGDCRLFHKDLEGAGIVPDVLVQDINGSVVKIPTSPEQKDKEITTVSYEVDNNVGTVEEMGDLPETIGNLAAKRPMLRISLECMDEEDHSEQHNHVYHNGHHYEEYAKTTIRSVDDMLAEKFPVNERKTVYETDDMKVDMTQEGNSTLYSCLVRVPFLDYEKKFTLTAPNEESAALAAIRRASRMIAAISQRLDAVYRNASPDC